MKKIIILLVLVLAAVVLIWTLGGNDEEGAGIDVTTDEAEAHDDAMMDDGGMKMGVYSMANVKEADSITNCWTVIRGDVYDLTAWIARHPGGEANILKLCGIDGTSLFEKKHGGSALQEETLVSFKIGTILN